MNIIFIYDLFGKQLRSEILRRESLNFYSEKNVDFLVSSVVESEGFFIPNTVLQCRVLLFSIKLCMIQGYMLVSEA
jgi:hypothetical protein